MKKCEEARPPPFPKNPVRKISVYISGDAAATIARTVRFVLAYLYIAHSLCLIFLSYSYIYKNTYVYVQVKTQARQHSLTYKLVSPMNRVLFLSSSSHGGKL